MTVLALESDHEDIRTRCRLAVDEFNAYMRDLEREIEGIEGRGMFYEKVVQLRHHMREHLHELEKMS